MFKKLYDLIFKRERWETAFFTQDVGEYSKIKGKLTDNGIQAKTKINNMPYYGTTYEILVKELDVYKSNDLIHNR